jgi:hypothetical protein
MLLKKLLALTGCILTVSAIAQTSPRRIRTEYLGKDSVKLTLNDEYNLIEDSCAQIIRYAKYDSRQRIFTGKFTDVNSSNPENIVSSGQYNEKGQKDGEFVSYYLNGNLQAKGSFKNNKFWGRWDLFYSDGKPKLSFDANEERIKLIDAWDTEGKKIVDNGNGSYRANLGTMYWSGKLVNGKPDGKWRVMKTDDRTNTELAAENFKNGEFQKGSGLGGEYKDVSRILLVTDLELPFTNAEKHRISSVPCNGVKRKHIVGAQYRNGFASFSEEVKSRVSPYLGKVDLRPYDTDVTFNGEVSEEGRVVMNDYSFGLDDKIASGLKRVLSTLPNLEPALMDSKPVSQKFTITFKFSQGMYRFSYRFLPVDTK